MIHYTFDKTLPKNLPLLFKKRAEEYPDFKLQAYKNAQGKFEYSSYSRVYNEVICYAAALSKLGVKDMLVDIGEIFCKGVNPDGRPWSVGIDRPVDGNNSPGADLEGVWRSKGTPCGIVTSGNYRKFYVRDGRKYAHTIDPRTGFPADNLIEAMAVGVVSGLAATGANELKEQLKGGER